MCLTEAFIRECFSDDELFKAISEELHRRVPCGPYAPPGEYVESIQSLPPGLKAMAATYMLDVNMALDDLLWYFWCAHNRRYCEEALWGLKELGADEAAGIFEEAYSLVLPHWDTIGAITDGVKFQDYCDESGLEDAADPLNKRMWTIMGYWGKREGKWFGLFGWWLRYARKHPEKVVGQGA